MSQRSGVEAMGGGVSGWSRLLGVSLRPWSGYSPLSLIVRGLIQLALCIFFAVLAVQMIGLRDDEALAAELSYLSGLGVMMLIVIVLMAAIGAFRLVIGVIDLVPRRVVVGTVVSVRQRKALDVLPHMAQRLIFERRETGLDRRRARSEVVIDTGDGQHQWTVRNRRAERELVVGATVRLSVTPLAGYVAEVHRLE